LAQYENIPVPTSSENLNNLSEMILIKSAFYILLINCSKIFSKSQKSRKWTETMDIIKYEMTKTLKTYFLTHFY